jgi:type I restriction enzyme M protein
MSKNNLLEITNNEKLVKSFIDDIKGFELMPSSDVIFFAYTLILLKKDNCKNAADLKAFLKKGLTDEENFIVENILKEKEEVILRTMDKYSLEDLEKIVLNDYLNYQSNMDSIETSNSIIDLALKLFNLKDKESIADFGCGRGRFLIKAFEANPNVSFYGNEINTSEKIITQIRSEILKANFDET